MRFVFTLVLILLAPAALASERVYRQEKDSIRFWDAACPYASVLRFIPEAQRAEYRKAEGQISGERYFGCWRDIGEALHLFWEDGDQGLVPEAALKDERV